MATVTQCWHTADMPSNSKDPICNAGDGVQPLGWEDPILKKEMATHSSILAWKISFMDRGPWLPTVHELQESNKTQ